MEEKSNTERFSSTVEHYAKYRPTYPRALLDYLADQHIVEKNSVIADIGSGTGIFTQSLLDRGAHVFAVEPNDPMRACSEKNLGHNKNFTSVNGTAENTSLPNASVGTISAATAFHWFDYVACQQEFRRILKPSGWVVLVWNLRLPELSPILQAYEKIISTYCPQYKGIPSQQITEQKFIDFFTKGSVQIIEFKNQQTFDLSGLIGRLRSTSYALTPEQTGYDAMINDTTALFHQYAEDNQITFPYTTKLYLGKLD